MSKEEIKNEKPDDILGIINEILDFNKELQKQQGSGSGANFFSSFKSRKQFWETSKKWN